MKKKLKNNAVIKNPAVGSIIAKFVAKGKGKMKRKKEFSLIILGNKILGLDSRNAI